MKMIPIKWVFIREEKINVLKVVGEGTCVEAEKILIRGSLKIINKAKKFNAVPYVQKKKHKSNFKVCIYFYLAFSSEMNLEFFLKRIELKDFST